MIDDGIYEWIDGWMDGRIIGLMGGGWMDTRKDGLMVLGWINGLIYGWMGE